MADDPNKQLSRRSLLSAAASLFFPAVAAAQGQNRWSNEIFTAYGDVELRTGPSRDSRSIGTIPGGSRLQAHIGPSGTPVTSGEYTRVLAHHPNNGTVLNGWVLSRNLNRTPASTTERDLSAPITQPPRQIRRLEPNLPPEQP